MGGPPTGVPPSCCALDRLLPSSLRTAPVRPPNRHTTRPRRISPTRRNVGVIFSESGRRQWRPNWLAGGLGFEPRLTESESAVLPLNYPPIGKAIVECNLGRSRRLVSLSGSARGSNVDTSRTSCAPFQAATAQTPLTPCAGPTCRMPRWQSPLAHRRRRREIPRAGTHDRGTARRSRAPPCRRYESRW